MSMVEISGAKPGLRGQVTHRHIGALDGIRGLAVLMVLAVHLWPQQLTEAVVVKAIDSVVNTGWLGVDLFFVLSGFLITGILLESKDQPHYFRNFYARRTLRIFPLYFGVLAAVGVVSAVVHDQRAYSSEIGWLVTYTQNIHMVTDGWVSNTPHFNFEHFWSLAVEEHFYLFWPLVVMVFSERRLWIMCLVLIVFCTAARVYWWTCDAGPYGPYALTPCRVDGMAIGAIACILVRKGDYTSIARWAVGVLAAGLGCFAYSTGLGSLGRWSQVVGIPAFALMAAGIIILASHNTRTSTFFKNRILRWFGKYSYGIYIYHYLLWVTFRESVSRIPMVHGHPRTEELCTAAADFVGSTVLAYASYHLYEKKFLRLKRFFKAPHDSPNVIGTESTA